MGFLRKIAFWEKQSKKVGKLGKKLGGAGGKLKGKREEGEEKGGSAARVAGRPADKKTIVGMEEDMAGNKTMVFSEKEQPPVVGWLVALNGKDKGNDFRLHDGKNLIGRGPGVDIVIRDEYMSSQHASINCKSGTFQVTDLDSKNGTFINDKQVSSEELIDHDEIKFGESRFQFVCLNL